VRQPRGSERGPGLGQLEPPDLWEGRAARPPA